MIFFACCDLTWKTSFVSRDIESFEQVERQQVGPNESGHHAMEFQEAGMSMPHIVTSHEVTSIGEKLWIGYCKVSWPNWLEGPGSTTGSCPKSTLVPAERAETPQGTRSTTESCSKSILFRLGVQLYLITDKTTWVELWVICFVFQVLHLYEHWLSWCQVGTCDFAHFSGSYYRD